MKLAIALVLSVVGVTLAQDFYGTPAEICTTENCKLSDGCICSSNKSPLSVSETPQFVVLSFDDSASRLVFDNYLYSLLFDRVNPDDRHIGATFYVPHEYTDYSIVNTLYNQGFEIGDHSISKNSMAEYWSEATKEELVQEFGGQRQILSTFANIPLDHIVGVRTPHFQINGNLTFEAYVESGLKYDSSWSARINQLYYPYTLNYQSTQSCSIGTCPNEPFPGFYVSPIPNLVDLGGIECNSLLGCNVKGEVDDVVNWLKENFDRSYTKNRAPVQLLVNSAWFTTSKNSFPALKNFLDYLGSLNDVFIVSNSQLLEWVAKPVPLEDYVTPVDEDRYAECDHPVSCPLPKGDEIRYMVSCAPCPKVYPWLGNPLGEST